MFKKMSSNEITTITVQPSKSNEWCDKHNCLRSDCAIFENDYFGCGIGICGHLKVNWNRFCDYCLMYQCYCLDVLRCPLVIVNQILIVSGGIIGTILAPCCASICLNLFGYKEKTKHQWFMDMKNYVKAIWCGLDELKDFHH